LEKKKIILIIVISLLTILVLGLGGYIIYDKVINRSDIEDTPTELTKKYSFKEIRLNKCFEEYFEYDEKIKTCTANIRQGNNIYNIKVINEKVINEPNSDGSESIFASKIIINNKEVFSNDSLLYVNNLYFIDNNIFFNTTLAYYYVVPYHLIIRYSIESEKANKIVIDEEISDMMKANREVNIVKNKMYFEGTIIEGDEGPEILPPGKHEYICICDEEQIKDNNIDVDTIANAIYELEYKGNNNFSTTKVMNLWTIQDVINQECED